jgi:hypothetical protein
MVRVGLSTLAHIWFRAVTGRRDRFLAASIGFLAIEGLELGVGRGDCPLGPFQRELGDPRIAAGATFSESGFPGISTSSPRR